MKKSKFIFLASTLLALSFASCSKNGDKDPQQPGETTEAYIDATSSTVWNYYSLAEKKLVGSAAESSDNNAVWAARKDWDIAVQRYNIRTNGGEFTTVGSTGGVHTFDPAVAFASVLNVPADAEFVADKAVTSAGMGGTTTVVRSEATVIVFKKNEDGSLIMPPVYLQAPVYLFRTADGKGFFKIRFTQYKNEDDATGHVKFDMAQIYK